MNIFHKGQGAFIKIFSLAVGLTVGLVLIAKVQLERNYDRCIVDKENVYAVSESFTKQGADPADAFFLGGHPLGHAAARSHSRSKIQDADPFPGSQVFPGGSKRPFRGENQF